MINLLVIHVKRVIIQVKNMNLLNNLKFSMIDKNISNCNVIIFISVLMNLDYERKSNHYYKSTLIIAKNVEIAYVKKNKAKRFVKLKTKKKRQ